MKKALGVDEEGAGCVPDLDGVATLFFPIYSSQH